jgi:hypothetical protein
VLKAATAAAFEPGPDAAKRIHQRHFVQGMEDVMAAKAVMQQSLFADDETPADQLVRAVEAAEARWRSTAVLAIALAATALLAAVGAVSAVVFGS